MSQYEVSVRGALADSIAELIAARFGEVRTVAAPGPSTVLMVEALDPAAQRALLTLLWDTGHEVLTMNSEVHARREEL